MKGHIWTTECDLKHMFAGWNIQQLWNSAKAWAKVAKIEYDVFEGKRVGVFFGKTWKETKSQIFQKCGLSICTLCD